MPADVKSAWAAGIKVHKKTAGQAAYLHALLSFTFLRY
jgi:hypothetical protein